MTVWPYLPVWPFLLGLCAICALFNWRAALAFALCIGVTKLLKSGNFPVEQIYFLAIYSCIGCLCFFLWDKVAGAFLVFVGMLYVGHVIGWVGHYPKVILAELVLVLGMFVSAYIGPSGGILARGSAIGDSGFNRVFDRGPVSSAKNTKVGDEAPPRLGDGDAS